MHKLNFGVNKNGLQWQLLSRFFLILITLFILFGVSQYVSMRQYLYTNKNESLQALFHSLDLEELHKIDTTQAVESNSSTIIKKLTERNMSVSVIDSDGNMIESSAFRDNDDNGREADLDNYIKYVHSAPVPKLSKVDYIKILKLEGNLEHTYYIVKDEKNITQIAAWRKIGDLSSPTGLIQLSIPVNDVRKILIRQIYIYLGGFILILIVGSLLAGTIFRKTLKPLYNMTETVENITVGELNTRLPENSGLLEIDKLSGSFNKMLTGIEDAFQNERKIKEKMRQFISDASHELRTPLTSIHGFVEVLLRGAAKNEYQLNSALSSILLESERLTKLVQDLLTITRLDQKLPVQMQTEDINEVINEIFPQLQILAGDRQLRLKLDDGIFTKINKDQLKQVVINLTQNAVQHTNGNSGVIVISTGTEEINSQRFVSMKVSDNGTGIDERHLDKVFDRFFRSESHRSREHGGYGLGLSIVKSIVEAHGGKIIVESTLGKGTSFTVFLESI